MCLFFIVVLSLSPSYGGWEADANDRIEQIRKRDAQITVVDSEGYPVPDVSVQIEQIKHRFAFGTALAYWPLLNTPDYRDFVRDHYEWAVCENDMKWGEVEGTRDVEDYNDADIIADWCADNDIILRGHCIFWEQDNPQFPPWVSGLDCDTYPTASEMLDEVNERIDSIVTRYAGQIVSWDVDNEMLPSANDEFGCLGEAGRAHMFQRANSIDPNCGMYMNEYTGNSFGGYDGDQYVARAQGLIDLGAPVEGLGIQAHLNSPFRPEDYYNYVLNELDDLGLPIIATEFDVSTSNVTQRATDLENFYRICFSHSSVEGIIQWGFWDGAQWRADAQLVETNWTINAAGQRYLDLLDEWTTTDSDTTDGSGNAYYRGFHGTYEITLSAPGQPAEIHTIELEPGETTALFELETNLEPPEPDITPPTPDPMTWAVGGEPNALGSSSITMTATTATDDSTPVYYYFECTNYGDANSGWQEDETYIAQGLNPLTSYTFRVKAHDSAVAQNETDWSTEESATTEPPSTDVEITGDWVSGLSHAEETGTNRALIFIAHDESPSGTPTLTSVTYGGQTMTKVVEISSGTTGPDSDYQNYVAAFTLNETGVNAATSGDFDPTWSATPGAVAYASVFLQNVDQTTSVGDSDSASTVSGANPIETGALSTEDGDMVIVAATCGNLNSYTLNNGFTEGGGTDQQFGDSTTGGTGVAGYKSATGVAETPKATYSATVNRQVIKGFVIQAAAGEWLYGDLTYDNKVDMNDLYEFSLVWRVLDCNNNNILELDLDKDCVINFYEYSFFAQNWLEEIE